ncbi:MAG: toll/interleukin-1 receptor domain-containing protein [Chitinophagaceae bacterium]|nr:toll/interleukin-1 receptor domain-containing protein [Chitinophagaceae bacterium]
MFITLQFPFVDLRRFLLYPPDFVPKRTSILNPAITDFERIAANEYVRCFGHYKLRGYIPKIGDTSEEKIAPKDKDLYEPTDTDDDWNLLNLENIWQDEYLYASAQRGLRFEQLEKQELVAGKLRNPRAKVRALRFSPFDPTNKLWSPCMRIETGIMFDVPKALEGSEIVTAVREFTKLKACVPVYEREGAGKNAIVKRRLQKGPLIEQHKRLARLIVNGTTAQHIERVHNDMVMPGEPLLSVHYTPDEITSLPSTVITLPESLTRNTSISYHPLKSPRMGLWLFGLPYSFIDNRIGMKKRETIRNNTIAIMRYWSELQAIIVLRSAVTSNAFEFSIKENNLFQDYVNKATNFLLSGSWHGARLDMIRNIINAHQIAVPDKQPIIYDTLKEFRTQIANKLIQVGVSKPNIFVSYSHLDADFLTDIREALNIHYQTNQITYFDDTYITAGEEWERTIRDSLENASAAVLLVSNNFLKSEYIRTIEQPKIIDRFQRGKLKIIPVLLDGKVPEQGFLSPIQFINGNKPFSKCTDDEKQKILNSLKIALSLESNKS